MWPELALALIATGIALGVTATLLWQGWQAQRRQRQRAAAADRWKVTIPCTPPRHQHSARPPGPDDFRRITPQ